MDGACLFEGSPYQSKQADPYSSHSIILNLLGTGHGERVLDVGAAHGYIAAALQVQGFSVTGIEGDPVLAAEAAKHCHAFFEADLEKPLPDLGAPFDIIIFGDVLEHLKDPLSVLRNAMAYLNEGGRILISLPNIANLYVRLMLLMGRFDYQERGILDRTHLRFFTRKTFRQFLADAGLKVDYLTATPIPLPLVFPKSLQGRLFNAVHGLNAWMAQHWQTMLGYQFIAVATKDANEA